MPLIPSLHITYFSSEPIFLSTGKKHYFTDAVAFGAKILGAIRQCLYNRLNRELCNERLVHNLASWQQKGKICLQMKSKSFLTWNNSVDDAVAR